MELHELTALELAEQIRERKVSSQEAVRELFKRIHRLEPKIHAFLALDEEAALRATKAADDALAAGRPAGRLAGVPVAVKDNLCTTDFPTTCASKILGNFRPPYDAHVVECLRREGAVIVGKTNLDEFAMGSSTENSAFGPTRNPWDMERIPGGSSGGSAAAVAADMAYLSLGSDTGGSIRQPAAHCGVVGLKPTYGSVSRYGLVAFASSLDQIGPISKDVRDTALMMDIISGHDRRDSTSSPAGISPCLPGIENAPGAFTVGVPREFFGEGLDPQVAEKVREALRVLEKLGGKTVEISLPHSDYAIAAYYIIAPAEASSNLARYDGAHYGYRAEGAQDIISLFSRTRAEGFGAEVKRRILLGTFTLSSGYYDAYYLKASKVRQLIRQDYMKAFEQVDFIVSATSPCPAFRMGERTANPLEMYLADIYTVSVNLSGGPGVSVPCGFTREGLPVGLQIMSPDMQEARLLQLARAYERETNWRTVRRPEL